MRPSASLRLLVPAAALLAAACQDSTSPPEPRAAAKVALPREEVPVRRDPASLLSNANHWADGYLETRSELNTVQIPGATYSFNRAGRGTIVVTKPPGTTGQYVATFSNLSTLLGGRSTLHVSGYYYDYYDKSLDGTYCKPASAFLVSDRVEVRCFKAGTGLPANAKFSLSVTRNYADLAFAYAHLSTSTNYSPSSQGSWNPAGTSTVTRSGVGQYRVTFNNLATQLPPGVFGHVQVNAVGTSNAHCNAYNFYTNGTPHVNVDVRCFEAPTGAPVDRRFTVLFVLPSEHLAYAWADKPTVASYTPLAYYSSNPAQGRITIIRSGVGDYHVDWDGVHNYIIGEPNLQVTAYGSNSLCMIRRGSYVGPGMLTGARVQCFAPNGTPVDSRFLALFAS